MSYGIRYLILVDYPVQHTHKAWLQPAPAQPVSSQVQSVLLAWEQAPGLCCLLLELLLLLAWCRSQECKSTAGTLVVIRRGWDEDHGCLKALRSRTVSLTWLIEVGWNNKGRPLVQNVNK